MKIATTFHQHRVVPVFAILLLGIAGIDAAAAQQNESDHNLPVSPQSPSSLQERNKALARGFYEDLWFSDNTDRFDRYVANEYVVHDIGDRKGVTEPAVEQKNIADFFHSKGDMTGSIDFQIAEGDLVATRWHWEMEPTSLMFRLMGGRDQIPIINVFRFEDDKIVEIWNHRHDIDTGVANFKFVKGFGAGLGFALLLWTAVFLLRRKKQV